MCAKLPLPKSALPRTHPVPIRCVTRYVTDRSNITLTLNGLIQTPLPPLWRAYQILEYR
jgi:hypothetical protein